MQTAVLNFQKSLTGAYWELRTTFRDDEPALKPFAAEIRQLENNKQYIAHQLVATDFRSFDLQGANQAVVTVRETWQDTLHTYAGSGPDYSEPAIAERGPYDLDVTYNLQAETTEYGTYWRITRAVMPTRRLRGNNSVLPATQSSQVTTKRRRVRRRLTYLLAALALLGALIVSGCRPPAPAQPGAGEADLPRRLAFACDAEACASIPPPPLPTDVPRFRRGEIDLTGDGVAEVVERTGTALSILEQGQEVWHSPATWQVLDAALGDPNDDGRYEDHDRLLEGRRRRHPAEPSLHHRVSRGRVSRGVGRLLRLRADPGAGAGGCR